MFDKPAPWDPPPTPESEALLTELTAARRTENQAAARRIRACGRLFEVRRDQRGESEDWAVDAEAAVGAEIAAALRISRRRAASFIEDGRAMRRLPALAAVFEAGEIDAGVYRTIVYRTELITDPEAMTAVDQRLAVRAARWPSLSYGRLLGEIDRIVYAADPDAVRRVRERAEGRGVRVLDGVEGVANLSGCLFAADAHLFDKKLTALAATVCEHDPRTKEQRRADAVGALAAGAERLMCRCGSLQCPAAAAISSPVVIHVVAEQATLEGRTEVPGYLYGADALIPAELVRELAATARLRPLAHPADAESEPRYRPSRALADFVRARDLTCRAPGCDRPATDCDLDHTVPYPHGPTHRSNMKCLCRFHHILKTFWGWQDKQLPDGTVIWTLPGGRTYVTTPGSALLFPSLMAPTGPLVASLQSEPTGERALAMPQRRNGTRAEGRAHRIVAERSRNRKTRERRHAENARRYGFDCVHAAGPSSGEPPPF